MTKAVSKKAAPKKTAQSEADKAAKVEKYLNLVKTQVSALVQSDDWANYLSFCAKLRQYSFTNTLLLYMQDPEASIVRTAKQWGELGRAVSQEAFDAKAGAVLYRPIFKRFPVEKTDKNGQKKTVWVNSNQMSAISGFIVFDVRHTSGKDLPFITKEISEGFRQDVWDKLVELTESEKLELSFKPMAETTGGYYTEGKIVLNQGKPQAHQLKTLIHELVHHFNEDLKQKKGLEERSTAMIEIIAEGTAYYVAMAMNIDTAQYSVGYLASWSRGNVDLVEKAGTRIVRTGEKIVMYLKGEKSKYEREDEEDETGTEAAD